MKKFWIIFFTLIFFNACSAKKVKQQEYFKETNYSFKSFIIKNNKNISSETAEQIINHVIRYSNEISIDPKIIMALMARESSFRVDAVSKSGASGLGQLMKSTAKDLGVNDLFNPEENIKGTIKYLGTLLKHWNNNMELALASYKLGLGTVKKLVKNGSIIPEHTRNYISEINYLKSLLQ